MRLFGNAIQNLYGQLSIQAPLGISALSLVGGIASNGSVLFVANSINSNANAFITGPTRGLRIGSSTTGATIDAIDSGASTFEPLTITGSTITLACPTFITVPTAGTPLTMGDGTINAAILLASSIFQIGTISNHSLSWYTNNATRFTLSAAGGLFASGVTGGDKGVGTGNFTGVFVNGSAIAASAVIGIIAITFNGGSAPSISYSKNLGATPSVTRSAIGTYVINHNMNLTNYVMSGVMNNGGAAVFIPEMSVASANSLNLTTFSSGVGNADPANTYVLYVMITTG